MRGKRTDLQGRVFGRLTVERIAGVHERGGMLWECRCVCGKLVVKRASRLLDGHVRSCGARSCRYPDGRFAVKRARVVAELTPRLVRLRVARGWSLGEALTVPVCKHRKGRSPS